jgi:hypothetical protein
MTTFARVWGAGPGVPQSYIAPRRGSPATPATTVGAAGGPGPAAAPEDDPALPLTMVPGKALSFDPAGRPQAARPRTPCAGGRRPALTSALGAAATRRRTLASATKPTPSAASDSFGSSP